MLVASPPPPEAPAAPTHVSLPPDPEPEGPPQAPIQLWRPRCRRRPKCRWRVSSPPPSPPRQPRRLANCCAASAAERQAPVYRSGPSIEDVVREELRPLLKAWLDQHLPPLVERLVRTEIERVVGRALG